MSSIARKSKDLKINDEYLEFRWFKVYQCTQLISGAGLQDVRKI
jgi:hypothetical protein